MSIVPKEIYKLHMILIKIPIKLLDLEKMLKFIWKCMASWSHNSNCTQTAVITKQPSTITKRHVDQWNRTEIPEREIAK